MVIFSLTWISLISLKINWGNFGVHHLSPPDGIRISQVSCRWIGSLAAINCSNGLKIDWFLKSWDNNSGHWFDWSSIWIDRMSSFPRHWFCYQFFVMGNQRRLNWWLVDCCLNCPWIAQQLLWTRPSLNKLTIRTKVHEMSCSKWWNQGALV